MEYYEFYNKTNGNSISSEFLLHLKNLIKKHV